MINKKTIIGVLAAIVTVFAAVMLSFPYWGDVFIKNEKDKPEIVIVDKKNVLNKVINIEGMTCNSCEATVEKFAGKVKGVVSIKASVDKKNAVVSYDKSQTDVKEIMDAIARTGYKPTGYEDATVVEETKKIPAAKVSNSKCGAGKCGAGKCGATK